MQLSIQTNNIKLEKPFKYFLAELTFLLYSLIEIKDSSGLIGHGEAAHSIDANGELQEGAIFYEPYLNSALNNFDSVSSISDIEQVMKSIRLNIIHNTGLACGVEQALFEILSQKAGKNITELLGGAKHKEIYIQTTISIEKEINLYKQRIDFIFNNYRPRFVKFKVGVDLELESEAIRYYRAMDKEVNISIDANQAFNNVDEAINFLEKIEDISISWAEQLLAKDNLLGMKYLRDKTNIKLMADESVHSPLEAEYFCQNNLVDYINIKLAKTGGILKALEIIKIAEKYNKKVMLGSMLHGKLGIEYNLGFALSQDFMTQDFFSYFTVTETKDLGYIKNNLSVTLESLYGLE